MGKPVIEYGHRELNSTDQEILEVLYETHSDGIAIVQTGLTGRKITKQVSVSETTVNNHLRDLEEAGLVERQETPHFGATVKKYNELTEEGVEVVEENYDLITTPSDPDKLRESVADLKIQIAEAEATIDSLEKQVSQLEGAWGYKKGEIGDLQKDLKAEIGSFEEIEKKRKKALQAAEDFKHEVDEVEATVSEGIERINNIASTAESNISSMQNDLEEDVEKAESLEETISREREEIESTLEEVRTIHQEIKRRQEDIDATEDTLRANFARSAKDLYERVQRLETILNKQNIYTSKQNETYQKRIEKDTEFVEVSRRHELNKRVQDLDEIIEKIDPPEGMTVADALAELVDGLKESNNSTGLFR